MSIAGSFLVAQPSLSDPNFSQTVVLILAHSAEGAFGLVVNRPAKKVGLPFPVFHGGPCPAPGMFMLHGHADWIDDMAAESEDGSFADAENELEGEEQDADESDGEKPTREPQREVAPGIYLGDPECLKRASQPNEGESVRFRAYQGYAGWGPGQLETELNEGAWLVTPADSTVLFETPVETLWRLLGPPRIPRPSLN